ADALNQLFHIESKQTTGAALCHTVPRCLSKLRSVSMARKQCQVCGQPATVRVEANLNGRHSTMLLCDDHYRHLVRQQKRTVSPLEALFGARSGLFEDFLGSDFFRIGDEST